MSKHLQSTSGPKAGIWTAFFLLSACRSSAPEPPPQPPPVAEPTARPTVAPVPTATPAADAYIYDEQRRVIGWRGQTKLSDGQSVDEYCKVVYSTQDAVINGFFCSTDPPTEEAADQVYQDRRRAYDESKNRSR